ncbi:MAG: glycosyltransferase family protein [Magnetococcales bacterium]|nr:glycosyltransferase family protein [Magnetococcales bacterium]
MSDSTSSTALRDGLADMARLIDAKAWPSALEKGLTLARAHPVHPHVLHLLGVVKRESGDLRGALDPLSRAVAIQPENSLFQLDLGILLKKRGARAPAMERLNEAIRLDPKTAIARFHLGDLYMDQGNINEAIDCFTSATRLKPDLVEGWINLGLCQKSQNQIQQALMSFDEALARQPEQAEAHVNRAMALLMLEDYPAGWRAFEWRFKLDRPSLFAPPPPVPRWQGEPLENKTILLLGEQGFGDMIQFIRFAKPLADQGARVLALVPAPLVRLFENAPGLARVQAHPDFQEPLDYQIPLLSVPGVLDTRINTIPGAEGYLTAPRTPDPAWGSLLAGEGLKVGLVWEGKPLHANDPLRRRSCTLADLAPLARVPGIRLFSLQKPDPDRPAPPVPEGVPITPLAAFLTDFAATATLMHHLDLIITIDTATAHLAGALGRPVRTLLPRAPDWRWGCERDTTPWYRAMRLFRQSNTDSWNEPVRQLLAELEHATCQTSPSPN